MTSLELIAQSESVGFQSTNNVAYTGISHLELGCGNYTPIQPIIKPIGSQGSGMSPGATGNIRHTVAPFLQERYDFSGDHKPAAQYDILGASHNFSQKALGDVRNIHL